MCEGHAPRLADCGFTAGHGHVVEMGEAVEAIEVTDQHFPAPDAAVCAITGAVERKAYDGIREGMLGHARRYVGVMMLDGDEAEIAFACELFRPACR